jgi:hypothetical protein
MKIRYLYFIRTIAKVIFMFSLGMLTLVCGVGCSQDYGRIQWDEGVTQFFKAHQVQPGYKYYYYGVGMRVFAIVGLDPELKLESKMWRELATDSEEFEVATSRIWDNPYYYPHDPRGASILNPDGEKVGVYYSSLIYVTIKFQPENHVSVIPDTAFLGGPDGNWNH